MGSTGTGNNNFTTIKRVTLSSGFSNKDLPLSKQEEKQLADTVVPTEVFRGISVLRINVTPEQFEQLKNLSVGDKVPDFIAHNNKNRFTSATTKESKANSYANGGNISLVIKAVSDKSNTWGNLSNISKVSTISKNFSSEDLKYFKREGEVLMKDNTKYIVHSIKVN